MPPSKDLETVENKLPTFLESTIKTLNEPTPKDKIKTRPGSGGMSFSYVEVGYVIAQLDKAFNKLWEFEITEQQVGDRQVWVKGRLTVHLAPNFSLKKDSFGSSEIKKYGTGTPRAGQVIDIGNDFKAAQADALKKAASYLGVASDIFYKNDSGSNE